VNEETRPPAVLLTDIQLRKNTLRDLPLMPYIYVVPIATPGSHWLAPLEQTVAQCFGLPVKRMHCDIDLHITYDPGRRQYNSSQILLQLISSVPSDAFKILGVTSVDLFIPILTYVFGEAQLGGIGALVSIHRLNNRLYGLPDNDQLLRERLTKEAVHELGHTFGLLHCSTPGCVLNASTYVEDIDQKSDQICQECRRQITDHVSV
jgi:archaemetzincin